MGNTYHQIYLQTVFAVKYRQAVIDKEWNSKLFGVIDNLFNESNCKAIIVNGVVDHVHCFFGLKPVVSVSELMKTVKAKSSKYINDNQLTKHRFEWQEGYGVFSFNQSSIDSVYKIRKIIIKSRLLEMNTWHCSWHLKLSMMRNIFFRICYKCTVPMTLIYLFRHLINGLKSPAKAGLQY